MLFRSLHVGGECDHGLVALAAENLRGHAAPAATALGGIALLAGWPLHGAFLLLAAISCAPAYAQKDSVTVKFDHFTTGFPAASQPPKPSSRWMRWVNPSFSKTLRARVLRPPARQRHPQPARQLAARRLGARRSTR